MLKRYLFSLITLSLISSPLNALKNEIIVKIDDNIITAYEIKNKIKTSLILTNQTINQENINKNKIRALNYLIDLKLKKNELVKYKFDISNINVNKQLLSLSSNNINEFQNKFNELGINFELFVNEIKIETAWKQLMFNIYKEKVIIMKLKLILIITLVFRVKLILSKRKLMKTDLNKPHKNLVFLLLPKILVI